MAYTPGWMSQEGRALISSSPHTPPKEPPTCQALGQHSAAHQPAFACRLQAKWTRSGRPTAPAAAQDCVHSSCRACCTRIQECAHISCKGRPWLLSHAAAAPTPLRHPAMSQLHNMISSWPLAAKGARGKVAQPQLLSGCRRPSAHQGVHMPGYPAHHHDGGHKQAPREGNRVQGSGVRGQPAAKCPP